MYEDGLPPSGDPFDDIRLTPMEQSATGMHEMYLALCKVGFSDDQALFLTAKMVTLQSGIEYLSEDGE